jgi:hypothetical protein
VLKHTKDKSYTILRRILRRMTPSSLKHLEGVLQESIKNNFINNNVYITLLQYLKNEKKKVNV